MEFSGHGIKSKAVDTALAQKAVNLEVFRIHVSLGRHDDVGIEMTRFFARAQFPRLCERGLVRVHSK